MVRAGTMRHRVEIHKATETANDFGELTLAPAIDSTVWAAIEPLSGQELFEARQVHGEVTHKITMRHGATVTVDYQLMEGARVFDIVSIINPKESNRELVLMCKESV